MTPSGGRPAAYWNRRRRNQGAKSRHAIALTLIVTATRGFELSRAVDRHNQLVKHGVDAPLHVWDGLFHGFFYNPDVPESRDCYDVIVRFFDHHLTR